MTEMERRLAEFADYAKKLKGSEKSESQLFCEHLFKAFGWSGLQAAGATLEAPIVVRGSGGKAATKFADLLWPGKVLVEMKSRKAKLEDHYEQAYFYWQNAVPHRPRYVLLCNFNEIWIYDFDLQIHEPMDRVRVDQLAKRYAALSFLFPKPSEPLFGNNRVAVTREAADNVASLYNTLVDREIDNQASQRFVLQCVVAMFSQSIGLLPMGLFTRLVRDCLKGENSYDLLGGLFARMNTKPEHASKVGRFKDIQYFNGGLFEVVDQIELRDTELEILDKAASENDWSKVSPVIFGTLFQRSMRKEARHALGAHFTSEAEIDKVVTPTIKRPWYERIDGASSREELLRLRQELESFQVLDPACGSGNFLYVAYRELVRVELKLVKRLTTEFKVKGAPTGRGSTASFLSIKQFHGIDCDPFAVELAKVTMLLGKKLAYDEVLSSLNVQQLGLMLEKPLPLDNLDDNIREEDALFCKWPKVDAIIGNPPFQSKGSRQQELEPGYLAKLRNEKSLKDVPGRADYCVYWFRRAHDELGEGKRAGLVGTKTIRENNSRKGGLDYIVQNGGTITQAVSKQAWSGEADVVVSIVNWVKGKQPGPKVLEWQDGDFTDGPWTRIEVATINSALSHRVDVTAAETINANADSGKCAQGQTHGHDGFLLSLDEAAEMLAADKENGDVLHPYLIGEDFLGRADSSPSRYVIDFSPRSLLEAQRYKRLFKQVEKRVLPAREEEAKAEKKRNEATLRATPGAHVNWHHRNFYNQWWLLSWPRPELMRQLKRMKRYIVCVRNTMRPVFDFVAADIHPSDLLQIFLLEDDYSFGILQSDLHWEWFTARCSTRNSRFRYTSETVFDCFPWPQSPTLKAVMKVVKAAVDLRQIRQQALDEHGLSRRDLYRALELPGKSPVKDAHQALNLAVRSAYGMTPKADVLQHLLNLNRQLAEAEKREETVVGPGLPPVVKSPRDFITTDCIRAPKLRMSQGKHSK